MSNQIILKIQKIEKFKTPISYEVKDGRKLIAEIFPLDSGNFEILMDGLTFYRPTLEEAILKVKNTVNEFWNVQSSISAHNTRLRAMKKKGFEPGHVEIILEWRI